MKKFLVVNHITTEKLVEADTREEAIEVALTMSPDTLRERTVVKKGVQAEEQIDLSLEENAEWDNPEAREEEDE